MPISTTERMRFLAEQTPIQKIHVCDSTLFSAIRSHMRTLFSIIHLPDDVRQNDAALELCMEMMKWLISPLMPDISLFNRCGLADENRTRQQWGADAAHEIAVLKELFICYREEGSLLNDEFVRVIVDLIDEFGQERIKIWCHPNERELFRELLDGLSELEDKAFICSLADYRDCPPVEAMIKFGPLRTRGMAKVPEALISSPNYHQLVRFVWARLDDEQGFSVDPVLPTHNYLTTLASTRYTATRDSDKMPFLHATEPTQSSDDLTFFPDAITTALDSSPCVLMELPAEHGLLLRPGSSLLVFSPRRNDTDAICYRHISEVEAGDYLLIHDADADLGELSFDADKAPLAAVWKQELAETYSREPSLCVKKMMDAGIDLKDLHRAVLSWTEMKGTVIHAPRRKKHFQGLLSKVLNPELIPSQSKGDRTIPGWSLAWAEVEASRVTAIQHGVVEHAIVNEQLAAELCKEVASLRSALSMAEVYYHILAPESGLVGSVAFYPVIGISSGFAAPADEFGKSMKLIFAEQYRVE